MAALTYTFPARKSAMDMPQFQDPELKVFKDMLPYARTLPPNRTGSRSPRPISTACSRC